MPRPADPALESLWRRRLRQQPSSGLTIHQFCQREGFSTAAFHSWKRRLALRATSPCNVSSGDSAFVPVIVPLALKSQPDGSADLVTIQLANGGRILLPIAAGADLVCQVVDTVARSSVAWEDSSC
jgi:hypothetical protein